MLELGYLGYGGVRTCMLGGTRISRIWWNYDVYDMEELGYLVYGVTTLCMIRRN